MEDEDIEEMINRMFNTPQRERAQISWVEPKPFDSASTKAANKINLAFRYGHEEDRLALFSRLIDIWLNRRDPYSITRRSKQTEIFGGANKNITGSPMGIVNKSSEYFAILLQIPDRFHDLHDSGFKNQSLCVIHLHFQAYLDIFLNVSKKNRIKIHEVELPLGEKLYLPYGSIYS